MATIPAPPALSFENRLFIGGKFVDAARGGRIPVLNPHDNTVITEIAEATAEDVDLAVAAARKAFPAWKRTSAADRGRLLAKLADAIEADYDNLTRLEATDTGHPLRDTRILDVPRTVAAIRYYAGLADKIDGRIVSGDPGFHNYVTREPMGVCGQIVPWNFPMMFVGWKFGPALASGNTIVMKPSEITPLTTLRVARLAAEVGFPAGVINIVPGYGHTAGQHLAEHPDVDKIAFTGSTFTGRKIVQASAGNLKRVQLELGGKGANIVFDDANLDAAVNGSAFAIFHNQGQACIAGSRLLLHEKIADAFLEKFVALAQSIRVGNPLDPMTEMGPLTSTLHRDRVLSYIAIAKEQGGAILTGGEGPSAPGLANGCYLNPTVVIAKPSDRVCQEEVFGPFVSVTRFKSDDEVIDIANGTEYGLGGGLWTTNLRRAHSISAAMRAGMIWVNCYKRVFPGAPFGGVGLSGYGRDLGIEAIEGYTFAKSVNINVDAAIPAYYPR
jgi:aldehyde dehydrogenase (NAD+)/betaine-aldehyde dehydrogenase